MMNRPRHTRRDLNVREIVQDIRKLGAVVWILSDLGGEVLDLMVFWRGKVKPVEVKQPGYEDDFTKDELKSILALGCVGVAAIVATKAEDVVEAW
jgi:hypothetical protein